MKHEDAFAAANKYAGKIVNMTEAIAKLKPQDNFKELVIKMQKQYEEVFEAFISGVDFVRTAKTIKMYRPLVLDVTKDRMLISDTVFKTHEECLCIEDVVGTIGIEVDMR